jgi:ElaB/YqjD/DUF883 family membrane-anchored ribosome-binding protein
MKWLTFFVVLACSSAAAAQPQLPPVDLPCAPDVPEPQRRSVMSHQGQAGLWFHVDVARCMAERLTVLPLYAERVRLLEQALELRDQRHELALRQVEVLEQSERIAVDALATAERRAREAEERASRWHRHPALWFIVGVAATIGAQVGVYYLTR